MVKPARWRVKVQQLVACNCNVGCPCSFNSPPTYGTCEAGIATKILEGKVNGVSVAGLKWAAALSWPKAIHEKNGRAVVYLDPRATGARRDALEAMAVGRAGGPWGMFMSTCTAGIEVRTGPVEFDYDGKKSGFSAGQDVVVEFGPMLNPVSGDEHHVTALMPTGLLCKREDFYTSKRFDVKAGPLAFSYPGRHTLAFTAVWKGP